jgi:hypothetical protein
MTPLSIHPNDTLRVSIPATEWLRGQTISSVVWEATNPVAVSNDSVDGAIATAYITVANGTFDTEHDVDVTFTTTATPARVKTVTVRLRVVKTYL